MLDAAGDIASATLKVLSAVPASDARNGSGLWDTVDHPVRVFLADQAAHLPVAPAALYAFWQLTGLVGLVGGCFGNAGARIAWLLFGLGSLAMIWSQPAQHRGCSPARSPPALGATYLNFKLRRHGIAPRAGRNNARLALATDLPVSVLADFTGTSISNATRWTEYSRRDWLDYLASRTQI
ncbi:hypothetical protein [Streptomyces lavendofoliae]|nr:hypothetical protein [Streptomyces lavendofoliae]